jgi:hypothetical protein
MLLCFDYQNGITNEEENIIFLTKPKLLSIKTISLLDIILVCEYHRCGGHGC